MSGRDGLPQGDLFPLVTVGIPTYRRPDMLRRAITSALAQTYPNVEVLVADDASGDSTAALVTEFAADEPRLRFHVHPQNLGHTANYRWTLDHARGAYFCWLSDDDHLDPGYIAACMSLHRTHPGTGLVTGRAVHTGPDRTFTERRTELLSRRPFLRVGRYFLTVDHNSGLFGVARTAVLRDLGFPDAFGGDWELVAVLASRGPVRYTPDAVLHRSLEGLSSDAGALAELEFSAVGLAKRWPHVGLARRLATRIATGDGPHRRVGGPVRRGILGMLVFLLVAGRFVLLHEALRLAAGRAGRPKR